VTGEIPWRSKAMVGLFKNLSSRSHTAEKWRRLKSIPFHSSTIQTIMVDTSRFTGKGEVWNNLYAGIISKESGVPP
jgi:hypothetical protein